MPGFRYFEVTFPEGKKSAPGGRALFMLSLCVLLLAPLAAQAEEPLAAQPGAYEPAVTGTISDTSTEDAFGEVEAPALAEDPELSAGEQKRVEEIVVSARRRAELLEDTPVAVTALTPSELVDSGVTSILGIGDLVPNLQVIYSGAGAAFVIRGVGSFPGAFFDQGTGLYLDGVYIPRQQGNVTELIDIAQIEVLRGPQGTLFGKNSAGGAVKITTVAPEADLGAYARVRYDSNGNVQTRATVNAPLDFFGLGDRLSTRLNFGSTNQSGYVENVFLDGKMEPRTASLGFLGALRFEATDDLVFDLAGMWNKTTGTGGGQKCAYIQNGQYDGIINLPPAADGPEWNQQDVTDACLRSERFRNGLDVAQSAGQAGWMVWGTGTWDIGDAGPFEDLQGRLLSSWREFSDWTRVDVDGTQYPLMMSDWTGQNPLGGRPTDGWSVTEELQLSGSAWDGRINFVSGLFGSMESFSEESLLELVPGSIFDANGGTTIGAYETNNWDFSIFGQADLELTEEISITGGLRYERAKKAIDRLRQQPLVEGDIYNAPGPIECQPGTGPPNVDENGRSIACVQVTPSEAAPYVRVPSSGECAPGTGPLPVYNEAGELVEYEPGNVRCEPIPWTGQRYFSSWSPMASIQATFPDSLLEDTHLDHMMTYFQYARGYKNGGFNGAALGNDPRNRESFDSETADTFEVGIKTISFENILTANFTWFVTFYKNLQLPVSETMEPAENCPPPPGLSECQPIALRVIRNAPQATIRGFEFDFQARPLPFVLVSGNLGLQDARLDQFDSAEDPLTGQPMDVSGNRFSYVPQVNSHLAVSTPLPLDIPSVPILSGIVEPRVDWSYQSEVIWGNHRFAEGAEANANIQEPWHNLRLRLNYIFNDGNTSLAVFGNNMLDTEILRGVLTIAGRVNGTILQFYDQGRSVGVEVSHTF